MEIDEKFYASILYDYYHGLLSEKQQDDLRDYLQSDYSISEIAKDKNISRQAVYDSIRRGIEQLKKYEAKLRFYAKEDEIYKELDILKEAHSEISSEIEKIQNKIF